jgi:hypothetical protein
MHFGNFLDGDGDFVDTVHFPPVAAKFPFRGKGIYSITGKVMIEFDCVTIEVSHMERLAVIEDPRYSSTPTPKPPPSKENDFNGRTSARVKTKSEILSYGA